MTTIIFRNPDGTVQRIEIGEDDRRTAEAEAGRTLTYQEVAEAVSAKLYFGLPVEIETTFLPRFIGVS